MVNIFQDPTKSVPKSSTNIVRVSMTQDEISGRKDHMPAADESPASVEHIPNRGGRAAGGS